MKRKIITIAAMALIAFAATYSYFKLETDGVDFERKYKAPRSEQVPDSPLAPEYAHDTRIIEAEPSPTEVPDPEGIEKLQAYVTEAMTSWKKPPTSFGGFYQDVAHDIAWASLVKGKIWSNDDSREKAAIHLAMLALFEGAFLPYVDDGRCNSKAWRQKAYPKIIWAKDICDNGYAYSLWQLHPEIGIKLTNDGEWVFDNNGIGGKQLAENRKLAALVAHAFVKKSVRVSHGLCGYTGDAKQGCVKAKIRQHYAEEYLRKHPFR